MSIRNEDGPPSEELSLLVDTLVNVPSASRVALNAEFLSFLYISSLLDNSFPISRVFSPALFIVIPSSFALDRYSRW